MELSYFGKAYHGWQTQPNALAVQEVVEKAFSTLSGHPISLIGAGRTDAGVHAKRMYAHFDGELGEDIGGWIYRLNAFLPEDIAIHGIYGVSGNAHARFDAIRRTYEYWVVREKNPFYSDFAHRVARPLDVDGMNQAAAILKEHTDFKCFSRSKTDVKTYDCKIHHAVWEWRPPLLVFTISADRFLRNMVRAIVGTHLEVGTGRRTVADVISLIKSRDRSNAGPSVPAKGLYLTEVFYPRNILDVHE